MSSTTVRHSPSKRNHRNQYGNIILIGKAPGWEDAPEEGETWGVNDLFMRRPVKLIFELHDIEKYWDTYPLLREEIATINDKKLPVIMLKKYDRVPTSIPFPYDEMPFQYFSNSIAYMIAYAIHKEATEIDIFGVQMATREEYIRQRPCCEFWLGYAMAKGIKVNINRPSQLLNTDGGAYGRDWDNVGKREPYPDSIISNQENGVLFTRII